MREINAYWTAAYETADGDLAEASVAATKATCLKYHLAFYKGRGDAMERV